MIFPWHTDLFQPGRTACVVFRVSPLIWPTSSGAHHAPRPLCLRATRCTPGGFPRGAIGVGGVSTETVSSRTAPADPGSCAAKSTEVPALRYRFGGDDRVGWTKISTQAVFVTGCASLKTYFVSTREDAIPFCFKKA
jgi:hypothetical protein